MDILVKYGWYSIAYTEEPKSGEYQVILSQGDPDTGEAEIRLTGMLDEHGEAETAYLQWKPTRIPYVGDWQNSTVDQLHGRMCNGVRSYDKISALIMEDVNYSQG